MIDQSDPAMSPDAITLSLIATGVIKLVEALHEGTIPSHPYPAPLQRGLDRLVSYCLQHGHAPPQSVVDLLAWCQQPISTWGLSLPDDSLGEADSLLDGEVPTSVCDSWACSNPDVEAEMTERQFIRSVFEICRAHGSETTYRDFRRFLIEHRVLTALELQQELAEPGFQHLSEHLHHAYPRALRTGSGEYLCCARCGNLLEQTVLGGLTCENERCRASGVSVGRRIPAHDEAYWLSRGLRRFIADP